MFAVKVIPLWFVDPLPCSCILEDRRTVEALLFVNNIINIINFNMPPRDLWSNEQANN